MPTVDAHQDARPFRLIEGEAQIDAAGAGHAPGGIIHVGVRVFHGALDAGADFGRDGADERLPVGEVVVKTSLADFRRLNDVVHRHGVHRPRAE